jgi:hypothetical protein
MNWTDLLVQAPIVVAFIWYSLELQKRYSLSMDKRDEAYLGALTKITDALGTNQEAAAKQLHEVAEIAALKVLNDSRVTARQLVTKQPRARKME